ncbi:MAG: GGDEF domain-containing protein [Ruminococcus sp.]|nr:GGDEF domain-containing protein [Ruminococcus sp.]
MKEKNKSLNMPVLVIGILIFLALATAIQQIPQSVQGIITQIEVIVATIIVITNKKIGIITAMVLFAYVIFGAALSLQAGNKMGIVAILTSVVTIIILNLIYFFLHKNEQQHAQLLKQYEEMMDSNRLMQEKDEALQTLAYQDEMTDMHNFVYFREQIENAIRQNTDFALIYMDLDNFKAVNDKFGPEVGDEALKIYASRLKAYCGTKYLCARTSGDDFALLLSGTPAQAEILHLVEQLRKVLGEPVSAQGVSNITTTASYGIVVSPRDGKDTDTLLDNAIFAVYNAKANGKDRPCFFSQI